jgi:AraC-like DNA-binding protein
MDTLEEIRRLIARHAVGERLSATMPSMILRSLDAPTPPSGALFPPAFALIAQGEKRAVLGDRVYRYSTGDFLVVPVDLPMVAQVVHATPDRPYQAFAMALRPTAIADLLLEASHGRQAPARPAGLTISKAPPPLLDPIVRLLRLLDAPKDIGVLAPMLEREILWRLINSEQGWAVRQIGLAESKLTQISRAIRWMREHVAESVSVEDLAGIACMSRATFHRHFQAVTGMSPIQYQKRVRLQEARARLMSRSANIATVGASVGYADPSQFSREYSRMFGAPPSRDALQVPSSGGKATVAPELP